MLTAQALDVVSKLVSLLRCPILRVVLLSRHFLFFFLLVNVLIFSLFILVYIRVVLQVLNNLGGNSQILQCFWLLFDQH